jgi:hypothetical protein
MYCFIWFFYNMNIIFVTSTINISNKPWNFTQTRSVYTHKERFEQTITTLSTIKEKMQNTKIFLIECSPLLPDYEEYLRNNSDYFLNLYDENNEDLLKKINGNSKSLAEGTMTILGLEYLKKNNIDFENFFKITGRYCLNESFEFESWNNNYNQCNLVFQHNQLNTTFFKLNKKYINCFQQFLENSNSQFYNCESYEKLLGNFFFNIKYENTILMNSKPLGITTFIATDTSRQIGYI